MTEMQVYHETFGDISYVVLVVGRECHNGNDDPWDTDEVAVRGLLGKLPLKDHYKERHSYGGVKIFGILISGKRVSNQYHVYDATRDLEGTIADLKELSKNPNINFEISEGLPEGVRKRLPSEIK